MNTANAIRIEGMTKRYKGVTAVDRLDLAVPVGSVYGLLGENGAGKTTTLQSVLGLIAADAGKVETLGIDPATRGLEVRRRAGYVPEQPALYDWMKVAEIGWFASGFHENGKDGGASYRANFDGLVAGFGLPPKRKIKDLSKGMRSKVSLALALASGPELLVLDEPTSGLDILVRREFLESMVDLAGEGRTVLLSSHQIAEVERVASHVAMMHQGKLILAEPLDGLRARTFLATLTFAERGGAPYLPAALPLELIDAEDSGRQSRWLVHARERAGVESLRSLPGVVGLEVESPGLEEIYIGYMRGRRGPVEPGPSPAVRVAG